MQAYSGINNNQSILTTIFSRFIAAYLFIFILPFPAGYLSVFSSLNKGYYHAFDWMISWAAHYLFHTRLSLVTANNGSGDRAYNYLQLFVSLVLAIILTVVWSLADKKRKYHARVLYWLMVYVRFYFACTMMRYGMEKLIKAQFPFPYDSLSETYGESTPVRLMWSFMGYSAVYNLFIGGGEALAGFLMLFRKTTLAGALLGITILTNVAVLNFCFDVAVKLFVVNLLLVSFFIAAPHIGRLSDFFIWNKAVSLVVIPPRFARKNANAAWFAVKLVVTLCILYSITRTMRYKHVSYGDGAFSQTPLFGIYHTETFIRNNDTLLPLLTDTSQWKILNLIYTKKATIRMMNDSMKTCRFITDTINKKIQFSWDENPNNKEVLRYLIPDSNHLLIIGKLKEDSVYILMKKQDLNQYRLINSGFHWINETPHNQ